MLNHRHRFLAVVAAIALTAIVPVRADDTHHPAQPDQPAAEPPSTAQTPPQPDTPTTPTTPSAQRAQGMMQRQGMAGMGGQGAAGSDGAMMNPAMMMQMMQMMHAMHGGMPRALGMGDIANHVEGRIAFLHTELKIAGNQQQAWNGFADAMRTNGKQLAALRGDKMTGGSPSLEEQFDRQEKLATAQLEGLLNIKSAYERLARVLTDEQKKLAGQLIPPQIGLTRQRM